MSEFGGFEMKSTLRLMLAVLLFSLVLSCGEERETDFIDDSEVEWNEEYGKPLLGESVEVGKGDSLSGKKLLAASVDSSSTQVWEVRNQWADTDTTEAAKEGIAWTADSGLTWEEKYQAWIRSMAPLEATEGYYPYTTFTLVTPYGKSLPAPRLECAEVAIFARATFASWYHLPFILSAWDGGSVHFGHFGIRTPSGKYKSSPNFKNSYYDYESTSPAEYQANWPSDSKLRKRKLSSNGDDKNSFLCEDGCYAGAYFDEIFLNKRTGHFLVWLLTYTGSMHLANSENAFHIEAKAVAEGDVLLERWQKKGIGHTLVVKRVEHLEGGHISADLASGSMPRRQPKWEDGATSKSYFTNDYCGGVGESSDGDPYAKLGGGLKRFREAKVINGYWHNVVAEEYKDVWIMSSETERISERPATFEELLGSLSPEEFEVLLVAKIEDKRLHLRNYPASCAARIEREKAFKELYGISLLHFQRSKEEVDRKYRKYEDYVFAELEYSKSKTCCWNQSTAAMYEFVMQYNEQQLADAGGQCVEPAVFKATDGGYQLFKEYAESLGKGDEWAAWTEDESCPQKNVTNDTETEHEWTGFCSIMDDVLSEGGSEADGCVDEFSANHSSDSAAILAAGAWDDLVVCSASGSDWFKLTTAGVPYVVRVQFTGSNGDIDLYLYNESLDQIDSSADMGDSESVKLPGDAGTYFLEIKLYNGDSNSYSLTVEE